MTCFLFLYRAGGCRRQALCQLDSTHDRLRADSESRNASDRLSLGRR